MLSIPLLLTGASPSYAQAYYEDACEIIRIGVYCMRKWGDELAIKDPQKKYEYESRVCL